MKQANRYRSARRRGVVLVLVLIVMLLLVIMMAGYWQLSTLDGVEAGSGITSTKAFWVAEAGLHDALAQLNYDPGYRRNPHDIYGAVTNGALTSGVYAVMVAFTATNDTNNFTLIATGRVGRSLRVVQQTAVVTNKWPAAFDYAVSGYSNAVSFKVAAVINGNAYASGTLLIDNDAMITNGAAFSDDVQGLNEDNFTALPPPNPPPTLPRLDPSYYDGQIAAAAAYSPSNVSMNTLVDLSIGTLYVNGDATLSTTNGWLKGPGTLVATGKITLEDGVVVDPQVTLIAGSSLVLNAVRVGNGGLLYARNEVDLQADNGLVMSQSALLTPGDVRTGNTFSFSGILYAGGTITMTSSAHIQGSAVVGGSVLINDHATITYDRSRFPATIPIGLAGLVVAKHFWQER